MPCHQQVGVLVTSRTNSADAATLCEDVIRSGNNHLRLCGNAHFLAIHNLPLHPGGLAAPVNGEAARR